MNAPDMGEVIRNILQAEARAEEIRERGRAESKRLIARADERGEAAVGALERFAFYEKSKTAYAIVATGEQALYANIMLQKGVVQ